MAGESQNRWGEILLIASCLVIPLLAFSLLMLMEDFGNAPGGEYASQDVRRDDASIMTSPDHKTSGEEPLSRKPNFIIEALGIFYYEHIDSTAVPKVTPVFPGVRKDDRSSMP